MRFTYRYGSSVYRVCVLIYVYRSTCCVVCVCLKSVRNSLSKYGNLSLSPPGKGLLMVHSVLEGMYTERSAETVAAQQSLKKRLEDNKIKGFCRVIVSPSVSQGLSDM